ncbi:hypothetical protein CK203_115426 [Vitis vinifera]|uniref:Uncharacterized protein n=1 Tax=Vitis vinifera TaxID=29760 RepID=A0A438D6K1_VITVI|nr:hypothetical protein CK203_115426 [Vitis vinifera]
MMEELLGQVMAKLWKLKFMKNQALELHSIAFAKVVQSMQGKNNGKEEKQAKSGSQESNASNRVRFGAEMRKIWPSEDNCSRLVRNSHNTFKIRTAHACFSKYGCYVMAWMQSHGNFSHPEVISYELLEGEVFNSKFCINPLEPISVAIESNSIQGINFVDTPLKLSYHEFESNGAVAGEGATSTVKQPLRVTCDLHHKFEMEIPHEDQSSHYDHEKDKFAYLSMRNRIELGKRQVQQSQWGSKYALNGDDSYEHTVGDAPTIPTVRDMYGYQSSYTSSWNNHPNLATQPQPEPSMSTSSLEQAILKINKVMEDFVGEQQKINSHLNEKIDNMESSINVRMEGVYNDLSLRIEKVQDSIAKLTNLDIARGTVSFLLNPTITFKEPMQKDQGKC